MIYRPSINAEKANKIYCLRAQPGKHYTEIAAERYVLLCFLRATARLATMLKRDYTPHHWGRAMVK